jgi:hypothetical protein
MEDKIRAAEWPADKEYLKLGILHEQTCVTCGQTANASGAIA